MNPKEILLITLSNIGDVIVTTPVMAALKTQFPESYLTVISGPRPAGLLQGSRMIDELVIYDKHQNWMKKLEFVQKLRRKKYDLVVDLRHTAIPYLVSAKKRSPLFRVGKTLPLHEKHLEILKRMNLSISYEKPFDFFTPKEELEADRLLKEYRMTLEDPFILIAPFAASELKTWSLSEFKRLIPMLLKEFSGKIILAGGEREKSMMDSLAEIDPSRVIVLAGKTTLRHLAALIHYASLLLVNDSSALHLGYEMNRPTVGIFGPTDPKLSGRIGPHFRIAQHQAPCIPCEQAHCHMNRRLCLDDLTADTVFKSCQELLTHAAHA